MPGGCRTHSTRCAATACLPGTWTRIAVGSRNVDEKDLQSIAFGRVVTHRTGNPAHGAVDSEYAARALT